MKKGYIVSKKFFCTKKGLFLNFHKYKVSHILNILKSLYQYLCKQIALNRSIY